MPACDGPTLINLGDTMELDLWGKKWCISDAAIADLRQILGCIYTKIKIVPKDSSESHIQSLVKLEASQKGCRLWRNNVGASYLQDGSFIRYGLANESKAVNSIVKSADLIGIRPVKITPELVGRTIGQFISREVKAGHWNYTGLAHEKAQLRWAELIISFGGDAKFVTGVGSL